MSERGGEPAFERVAILGVGLIGGSFGLALRARGLAQQVVAYSRTPATRDLAVALGAADETAASPADCVAGADLVYLATPVASLVPTLTCLAGSLRPEAIVTDAGSSKQAVVEAIEALRLPAVLRFVGGHPMTGSEAMGVEHARADLFEDKAYAITPTRAATPRRWTRWRPGSGAGLAGPAPFAASSMTRLWRSSPTCHICWPRRWCWRRTAGPAAASRSTT